MESIAKLFSFRGRVSRLGYWRVQLLLTVILLGCWSGGLMLAISTGIGIFSAVAVFALIPAVVIQSAVLFQRLHDRGKSAWWLMIYNVGPATADVLLQLPWAATHLPALLVALVGLVSLGLSLWGFVEIGLRRGTRGPNRYGPEPVIA